MRIRFRMTGEGTEAMPTVYKGSPCERGAGWLMSVTDARKHGLTKDGTLVVERKAFKGSKKFVVGRYTLSTMTEALKQLGATNSVYVKYEVKP